MAFTIFAKIRENLWILTKCHEIFPYAKSSKHVSLCEIFRANLPTVTISKKRKFSFQTTLKRHVPVQVPVRVSSFYAAPYVVDWFPLCVHWSPIPILHKTAALKNRKYREDLSSVPLFAALCMRRCTREYWMICRGPGFLVVVRFGLSTPPPPHPHLPSVSSIGDTLGDRRQLTAVRERSHHTTAIKSGPL